jgi:hypothetical protein
MLDEGESIDEAIHEKMAEIAGWCFRNFNHEGLIEAGKELDDIMPRLASIVKVGEEYSSDDGVTLKLSAPAAILLYHFANIGSTFFHHEVFKADPDAG